MPSPSPSPPLRAFLAGTTLADVATRRGAVTVLESDEPVATALAALAARRILSAPVCVRSDRAPPGALELEPRGPPLASVAGFVSVADVLAAVADGLPPGGGGADPVALEDAAAKVLAAPLASLVPGGLGGAARAAATAGALADWRVVAGGHGAHTSLLTALSFYFVAAGAAPVHRVALADGGDPPRLDGVVSLSDVVAALAIAPPDVRAALDATPLPPPPPAPPVVVGDGDSALTAFRAMLAAHVSAVCVIDAAGRAVGSLSASDFRGLGPGVVGATLLPLSHYLSLRPLIATSVAHVAAGAVDDAGGARHGLDAAGLRAAAASAPVPPAPPLVTLPAGGASVGDAVAALARGRVHRAWLVDGEGRPVGVVTASDVAAAVLAAAGGAEE